VKILPVASATPHDLRSGRGSHTEWVARRLRLSITNGELPAGEPLRANDLARHWGMSPTPVREARPRDLATVMAEHEQLRVTCLAGETEAAVAQLEAPIAASKAVVHAAMQRRVRRAARPRAGSERARPAGSGS
jgi:DNA-binding GntR family transcriptional regulator